MGNTLYKFLSFNGFKNIVEDGRLKFSNLNEWKKSGDVFENYFSRCFESEEEFNKFVNVCMKTVNMEEKTKMLLLYFYVISQNTYALSLTNVKNKNSMAMWKIYGDECNKKECPKYTDDNCDKDFGIKIEFDNQLYTELKRENKEYRFMKRSVKYLPRENMPTISEIMGQMSEENAIEKIKKSLYFQKIDSYSYEAEYRYLITGGSLKLNFAKLMEYIGCFELTFTSFMNNREEYFQTDGDSTDAVYLMGNIKEYIVSVEVSPNSDKRFIEKIRNMCEDQGLKYLGESKIKQFEFFT